MKGQTFTLEACIAILIIFSMIIFFFKNPPPSLEYERINYKMKAYDALKILEGTGELRKHAISNNVTAINYALDPFIPDFLNYTTVIFNETSNVTPKPSIPEVKEFLSVSYLIAGDLNNYEPKDVRVYLWGYG